MVSEWISVKERLPEYEDSYVVHRPELDPPYAIATFEEGEWYPDIGDGVLDGVCYWMPLPPPPEPQLTVKEALREAIAALEFISPELDPGRCMCYRGKPLLPRLRAALEAE